MKQILGKLHKIMTEVDYIQKDKSNSFHGYRYASEQAIKEALHASLVKHSVIFVPVSVTITGRTDYTSDKGKRSSLTDVLVKYRFLDVESGESVEGECAGTGDDNADKGTYKAITGAIKYILTSTFLIPTGDDPEDDKNEAPKKTTTVQPPAPVKPPLKEFSATKEQFEQILDLASIKLAATLPEEIIPRINDALGTKYTDGKSLTRSQATDIITKLTSL